MNPLQERLNKLLKMVTVPIKGITFLELSIVVLVVAGLWFNVLKDFDKIGHIALKSDRNVVLVGDKEGCNVLIHTTNVNKHKNIYKNTCICKIT